MLNFYNYYKYPDLDNNSLYRYPLDLFTQWYHGEEKSVYFQDLDDVKHILKRDPSAAYNLAHIIKTGRWLEAEPYIMKDPFYAYQYAMYVIKRRWLEAEPYIKTLPGSACWYAINVIKQRWLEAEPVIRQSDVYWEIYVQTLKIDDEQWLFDIKV